VIHHDLSFGARDQVPRQTEALVATVFRYLAAEMEVLFCETLDAVDTRSLDGIVARELAQMRDRSRDADLCVVESDQICGITGERIAARRCLGIGETAEQSLELQKNLSAVIDHCGGLLSPVGSPVGNCTDNEDQNGSDQAGRDLGPKRKNEAVAHCPNLSNQVDPGFRADSSRALRAASRSA
jgi:hypothetical protein